MPTEKGKKGKASKRDNSEKAALSNYSIEYSKSSRATCKHCDIKICKVLTTFCLIPFIQF